MSCPDSREDQLSARKSFRCKHGAVGSVHMQFWDALNLHCMETELSHGHGLGWAGHLFMQFNVSQWQKPGLCSCFKKEVGEQWCILIVKLL